MKMLSLTVIMILTSGTAIAGPCFKDHDTQSIFGSVDQVLDLHDLAKGECDIVGFTFSIEQPFPRSTLVVADLENGHMARLKIDAGGRPWEQWGGFTREQVLADEPEDGFDLEGFRASSSDQRPVIPGPILMFIEKHNLTHFVN